MFAQDRAPKVGLHIGTTSSECTVSIRLHLGSTLAKMATTAAQFRLTWLHLRPNQVGVHMASKWITWPAKYEIGASPLGPTCAKLSPKHSKHVGPDLDFHMHHMASIWGPSGALELQPNMTNWRLGLQLGPKQHNLGPSWGQPRPKLGPTQVNLQTLCTRYFQRFLALMGVRARPCCPHRACIRRQIPVGGKLGPSWSQLARVRCKFYPSWDPSWAQVGSCSAQVKAKDGQV